MAKIDLTSFEWCELIFKGKNKAYGAYKMRADSPKRHNVAMVLGSFVTGCLCAANLKLYAAAQQHRVTYALFWQTWLHYRGVPSRHAVHW